MTELKPCPFCKAEVEIRCLGTFFFMHHPDTDCVMRNSDIPTIMEAYRSKNELIEAWNRRLKE